MKSITTKDIRMPTKFPEYGPGSVRDTVHGPLDDVGKAFKLLRRQADVHLLGKLIRFMTECGGVAIKFRENGFVTNFMTVHGPVKLLKEPSDEKQLSGIGVEVKAKPQHHKFLIGKAQAHIQKSRDVTVAGIIIPGANYADRESITITGAKEAARVIVEARVKELDNMVEDSMTVDPKHHRHFVAGRGEVLRRIGDEFSGAVDSIPRDRVTRDKVNPKGARNCINAAIARMNESVKDLEDMVTIDCEIEQPDHMSVMGAKGSEVQKITTDSNVQTKFPDNDIENGGIAPPVSNGGRSSNPNIIRTTSKKESCEKAANILQELVPIIAEVSVPNELHKYVIGHQGTGEEVHTKLEAAKNVEIQKSFEVSVEVYQEYHPEVIGRGGEVAKKLREDSSVQIQLPKNEEEVEVVTITDGTNSSLCAKHIIPSSGQFIEDSTRGSTAYATASRVKGEVIPSKDVCINLQVQVLVNYATKDTAYLSVGIEVSISSQHQQSASGLLAQPHQHGADHVPDHGDPHVLRLATHNYRKDNPLLTPSAGIEVSIRGSTAYTTASRVKWEAIHSKDTYSNLQVQVLLDYAIKDTAYLSVGDKREAEHSLQQQLAGHGVGQEVLLYRHLRHQQDIQIQVTAEVFYGHTPEVIAALSPTSRENEMHGISERMGIVFTIEYQSMHMVETVKYFTIPPTTISAKEIMAHRIMELKQPHASFYSESFSQIRVFEEKEPGWETSAEFTELFSSFKERPNTPKEEISSHVFTSITTFLGKLFTPSIFIHRINNQKLAVYDYKNSAPNQINFIQPNAGVISVLMDTYDDTIFHTVNCYLVASKVNIENRNSASLGNSEPATGALIFNRICTIFYGAPMSAIRTTVMIQWDKRDGSPPMNEIVCQDIDVFTMKLCDQGGKLDNVTAEKISYYLYYTTPTHSESDMALDSTTLERLPEYNKEFVRGAHHHQQLGAPPIQDLVDYAKVEEALQCYLQPLKIQHVLAKKGLLTLVVTCTVTPSSMTGFNKSEENFIWFSRKGDAHGEMNHCPLNVWPDAESHEDFVIRGDFPRMMGEFNTLAGDFTMHLVILRMETSFDQGLFQNHHATAGTSKAFMMANYQQKVLEGLSTVKTITKLTSPCLLQKEMVGVHSIPREYDCDPVNTEIHEIEELARQELSDSMELKEDLQSLTNACAILFTVTMAINNSASFTTVGGVLHWHSGDFPYSGKCSSLKKLISLLNIFEEWFDDTKMVVNIDVINATTAPIIMLHRLRDVQHVHRGHVQLCLPPQGGLAVTDQCLRHPLHRDHGHQQFCQLQHCWRSSPLAFWGLPIFRNGLTTPGWWSTST
jgi:ribosomal protein S3